jgi:Protein of unknown function (DUF2855)
MTQTWTLGVARTDLARTTLVEHELPELADGEALLRVDRVGLTANNVTYAVLGDAPFRYWEFFPPARHGLTDEWGVVPLWGFADVVESTVDGLTPGDRLYGYYPSAGHLVVRPGRADARGFRDASEHRSALPGTYNGYVKTTGDPAYVQDQEDLLILYRPLYYTSFMLADQVADNGFYGAEAVVLSSASSKTSYGTAFLLHGQGPRVVGLTSPGNVDFTRELGCYDDVVSYPDVVSLDPGRPTVYLDVAGDEALRARVRAHLGDRLVRDVAVGITHQEPNAMATTAVFFAPDQIRKRSQDWGRDGLEQRFAEAWGRFASTVEGWVDVAERSGPQALRDTWLEVLGGQTPPRIGHVIAL